MKKSSKFFAAALAAVLAFSVTGCAGADSSGEASSAAPSAAAPETSAESAAPVTEGDAPSGTLTFLSWQNETVMQPLLDGFKEKYPDVSVDLIYAPPVQDYVEKFQIMYSTGDLPDVFVTAAENKGEVLDNDIAKDISYLPAFEKMSDKNKETYTKDGKIYAFAPDAWIAGIFYNKKILEDNGIAVPTNREEYLASMATLKANGIQPWAFCSTNLYDPIQGYVATETINKNGSYDSQVNNGELTYADGWSEPVSLWAADYLEPGYINQDALGLTGDQVNEMFAFEECAYMIGATWSVATLDELNPDLEYGMLPWFGTEDGVAWMTGATGVGWSINAKAKNMPAAKAFLEYLSSDESLKIFQEQTGGLLAVDGIDFPIHPTIEEGYPYLLEGKFYLPAVEWKYSDALGNEMLIGTQEILTGNITPEQLVENMDKKRTELDAEQ